MFTYLGHTIARVGYKGKARDALFAAPQARVAAYTILRSRALSEHKSSIQMGV